MVYIQDGLQATPYQNKDKKKKTKEEKIKEKLRKSNDHWNDCRFQFHWNQFECVYLKTPDLQKNPFCYYTHKFYIKYGKQTCHFVGNLKLKSIDYLEFFNRQDHSAPLILSIASINVAKTKKNSLHLLQVSRIYLMKHQVK